MFNTVKRLEKENKIKDETIITLNKQIETIQQNIEETKNDIELIQEEKVTFIHTG